MLTDIEIAQKCEKQKITQIALDNGISEDYLELYGNYKAKVDYKLLNDLKDKKDGKLILVTAINPTAAGEGKTTTSIGYLISFSFAFLFFNKKTGIRDNDIMTKMNKLRNLFK